jgi:hypothetical protein
MTNIQAVKVEERLNQRVVFSVRVNAGASHMEFPIDIQDEGISDWERAGQRIYKRGSRPHRSRRAASRGATSQSRVPRPVHTLYSGRALCDVRRRDLHLLAGIGCVVYGPTEKGLEAQIGAHEEDPILRAALFCRRTSPKLLIIQKSTPSRV